MICQNCKHGYFNGHTCEVFAQQESFKNKEFELTELELEDIDNNKKCNICLNVKGCHSSPSLKCPEFINGIFMGFKPYNFSEKPDSFIDKIKSQCEDQNEFYKVIRVLDNSQLIQALKNTICKWNDCVKFCDHEGILDNRQRIGIIERELMERMEHKPLF